MFKRRKSPVELLNDSGSGTEILARQLQSDGNRRADILFPRVYDQLVALRDGQNRKGFKNAHISGRHFWFSVFPTMVRIDSEDLFALCALAELIRKSEFHAELMPSTTSVHSLILFSQLQNQVSPGYGPKDDSRRVQGA